MDEYAAFAAIYDDWASHMTEDVPFYVELVREADGPVVELAVGNGRVAIPVAQETGRKVDRDRPLAGDARPGAREGRRRGSRPRAARGRHARLRARRAGGARLLPVPGAAPPADVGGQAPGVRAGRRGTASRRAFRLERIRLQPAHRRGERRQVGRSTPGSSIASTTSRPTTGSTSRLESGDSVSLWWVDAQRVGRADRRLRARGRGALRRLRARRRSTRTSGEFVWVATRKPAMRPRARTTRSPSSTTRGAGASSRTSASTSRRRGSRAAPSSSSGSARAGSRSRSPRPGSA